MPFVMLDCTDRAFMQGRSAGERDEDPVPDAHPGAAQGGRRRAGRHAGPQPAAQLPWREGKMRPGLSFWGLFCQHNLEGHTRIIVVLVAEPRGMRTFTTDRTDGNSTLAMWRVIIRLLVG